MVEKVICEARIIAAIVYTIIIIVLSEVLDPQHVAEAPKIADQLFRDTLGNHVKMYAESRLAAAHVNIDLRVGRVVFQAPDVEVTNTTGLVKCMYFALIVEREGAI